MRTSARLTALAAAVTVFAACRSAPPPPPAPVVPLGDSAQAAIRWVDAHVSPISVNDSIEWTADQRAKLGAFVGDARVLGISEMTETTHEFTTLIRRMVLSLAESNNVRGLAIQGPMPEAMDVDRYVRTGVGDPKKLLHALNNWRYETREMQALVAAIRAWNVAHPDKQVGFYGFEIPTAAHSVQVITSLRDSVTGPALGAWLRKQYACVVSDEDAHWGLEGRAADSTYWNSCRPAVTAAADSIVALRTRLGPSSPAAGDLAFAESMARLIQHHVTIGLRHLPRQDGNAEHVIYLTSVLGSNAKLVVWGGDVEMGRLTLPPSTVQTGQSLGTKLSGAFRNISFMVGDGTIRIRRPATGRGGGQGQPGLSDVPMRIPVRETYEDIFRRASSDAYWVDLRDLPKDPGGGWLHGPRTARLVSDLYTPEVPELFVATVEVPKDFDAVVFVRRVTPARQ